jgi:hypothetical protein
LLRWINDPNNMIDHLAFECQANHIWVWKLKILASKWHVVGIDFIYITLCKVWSSNA